MFLTYQPHLYERDRRIERQQKQRQQEQSPQSPSASFASTSDLGSTAKTSPFSPGRPCRPTDGAKVTSPVVDKSPSSHTSSKKKRSKSSPRKPRTPAGETYSNSSAEPFGDQHGVSSQHLQSPGLDHRPDSNSSATLADDRSFFISEVDPITGKLEGLGISHAHSSTFPEVQMADISPAELSHYPLPFRLGLLRPSHVSKSVRKRLCKTEDPFPELDIEVHKRARPAQFCHGYYLCTPPPREVARSGNEFDSSSPHRPGLREQSSSSSAGSHHTARWKLEQYFRSRQRRTLMGTHHSKFHAFDRKDACYWFSYSVKSLVAEAMIHNMIKATAGLTVLDWKEEAPERVLDVGTGAGNWVMDMAKEWPQTEFIGLDLVPVQTPLQDSDLQRRVSWVVANIHKGIPFPDNSFDYVHIRLLNQGVPEDKWADLLAEAVRVLTPNGKMEIFEADWSFFGSPKEMMSEDLQDLVRGDSRLSHGKVTMWKSKGSRRHEKLEKLMEQWLQRRWIKQNPAPLIPFNLTTLDVTDIGQGKPRHFPILARSSTHRAAKGQTDVMVTKVDDDNREVAFTTRPQIGNPLPAHHFQVNSLDTLRMAVLIAEVTYISEARELLWDELKAASPIEELSKPWEHFGEFERDVDAWSKEMTDRADLEILLKSTFDWNEAASRMDNRINTHRESKRRKSHLFDENGSSIPTLAGAGAGVGAACEATSSSKSSRINSPSGQSTSEEDEGDEDTVRDSHTPTLHSPSPASARTSILAFRTTTVFTARKRHAVAGIAL